MTDFFQNEPDKNSFDNLQVVVNQLYKDFPYDNKTAAQANRVDYANSAFHRIYKSPLIPFKFRRAFFRLTRQINLDLSWFHFFNKYWTSVLGGRTLWTVYDLYFLQNIYRIRFQKSQVPDTSDSEDHLRAWQKPEVLYQLLHLVSKDALYENARLLMLMYKLKRNASSFLEFGCGTAPITTTLYDFYQPKKSAKFYIADLQSIAFHYATYKFQYCTNVIPLLLESEKHFLPELSENVDTIFCITVYEHTSLPLEITKRFYEFLSPGGLLFFDYVKSDGNGLDTAQALRERKPTLEFIQENFDILFGKIDFGKSMPLTIARKR